MNKILASIAMGCAALWAGCDNGKKDKECMATRTKLAGDIVSCKNDLSSAKEKIAAAGGSTSEL